MLRRVPDETASSLAEDYDLGGPTPAPFALHLVAYLQLEQACPALVASRDASTTATISVELRSAIAEAGCGK